MSVLMGDNSNIVGVFDMLKVVLGIVFSLDILDKEHLVEVASVYSE
jgi:hypothetical protein